jgi:hypothetical protein
MESVRPGCTCAFEFSSSSFVLVLVLEKRKSVFSKQPQPRRLRRGGKRIKGGSSPGQNLSPSFGVELIGRQSTTTTPMTQAKMMIGKDWMRNSRQRCESGVGMGGREFMVQKALVTDEESLTFPEPERSYCFDMFVVQHGLSLSLSSFSARYASVSDR